MKTIYQTSATVTGGRNGKVSTEDGALALEVRIPKELGGNSAGHTNPEQLFAAGYASCFDSALNMVMSQAKIRPESPSSVKATVGLQQNDQGGFELAVSLAINIPGLETEQAQELVEKAHHVCPYSNATRGNVDVQLSIV